MRRTLHDDGSRKEILGRLSALTPDSTRRWGTMTVDKALAHLADQLRFATRELEPRGPRGFLTWPMMQWLAIAVIPWPHGRIQTSPELLQSRPATVFDEGVSELVRLIEVFSSRRPEDLGPHPMFGTLSSRLWGILAYRHLDYHLRQFGE